MISKDEARIDAWVAIANLMGRDYFKSHFVGACQSYSTEDNNDIEYEYFIAFESDQESKLWTVFARVSVNRETGQITFLDYKTPDGKRMENPIKPISFA